MEQSSPVSGAPHSDAGGAHDFAASDKASPRVRRIQRTALALLLLSGIINYIDRATLSIANPLIRQDLGLSVAEMGLLLSAFLWAYAFAQLPAGAFVDRFGARVMLSVSLATWSVAQAFGGVVNSFGQFFAARMILGIGEAPQFPTSAKVVRDWFGKKERGAATGIWNSSSTLGTAISAPLLTVVMLTVGWRWMFGIMGIAGLVVALGFYLVHRDPHQVDLTQRERAYLNDGEEEVAARPTWNDWRRLFGFGTTWGMLLGFFGTIYVLWLYNAWLPTYLQMEFHLTIAKSGWVAAVPYLFGVVGSLSGGKVCDVLAKRGVSAINSRKYPMAASLLGVAFFTVLTGLTHSATLAVVFISISMLLLYVSSSAAWAMASVAAPANCTASIGAMQNFGGYFGGALAPVITGFIVQQSHSFQPALFVGAAVAAIAVVGYWVLVRQPIPAAVQTRNA
ncbi:MFS transporter [Caballeronia grimmiae]|uniref:MFS transporter n=1 Tax=Caballeronia grimmiae TaxID=1071679 RepID=A0A069P5G5_9BURK|nr:MFS transporter [Caballeronia grimmiae]KDR35677.1 MFS transporter [Caballeronia grimmiae]GGD83164.1 MFS transporter [Caballeronia grimmiae]